MDPEDDVGFVHIETIARRSALSGWEISAHRHARFHQVLILQHGKVEAKIDALTKSAEAPTALIAPAGTAHRFSFAPDTSGWVLTVSADFLSRPADPQDPLHRLVRPAVFDLPPEFAKSTVGICENLLALQEASAGDRRLHLSLAESIIRAVVAGLGSERVSVDRRVTRLMALIEAHYRETRAISAYAADLAMTSRSLARLTAARLGCSPAALIERRRILEARRLLRFSNVSVGELAEYLGYADSSYFARAFRRATGHSPRAERAAVEGAIAS